MAKKQDFKPENLYTVIIHRLGYISCFCGYTTAIGHECDIKRGKVVFDCCTEDYCSFCDSQYDYELQRRQMLDGYVVCGQCKTKLGRENICGDCFCQKCFKILSDCNCCNFCGHQTDAQCACNDSDKESNDA